MRTLASERAICSASLTTRSIAGSFQTKLRLSAATASITAAMSSGSGGSGMYSLAPAWRADAFGVERRDERRDRLRDVDHDEIGALGAQHVEPLRDRVGLGHGGAALHRDLRGGDELAGEPSDDEKAHVWLRFAIALVIALDDLGHGDAEALVDEHHPA